MYHSCMYKFSRAVHYSSWTEEIVLQSQKVCWTPSKRPSSHAQCILSVGEGKVRQAQLISHDHHATVVLFSSQQGEQAEWDFCQSNFLANSSLRMAGEARVSLTHTYAHKSWLLFCHFFLLIGTAKTATVQCWFSRGVFCTLSHTSDRRR